VRQILALSILLLAAPGLEAATLEDIVTSFAVPSEQGNNSPQWSAAERIPEVKWDDRAPRKLFSNHYVRAGEIHLPRQGRASLILTGDRATISEVEVAVEAFEKEKFFSVLRSQFSSQTRIEFVNKCDIGAISGFAYYKVTLRGRKPLFVQVGTDAGGSAPNSQMSSFVFLHKYADYWKCGDNP